MQFGFFDRVDREKRLTELGDNLERLNKAIDWEMFRPILTKALYKEHKGAGGRPRFDPVMMLKILILQRYYNLSDEQTEYQITDRISFMRFLGLGLSDKVPDAKTIWYFRNQLTEAKAVDELFNHFEKMLEEAKIITHEGSIIDATFAETPKQHNKPEEKEEIKAGKIPEEWQKPEEAHKLAQKDLDARYSIKRKQLFFGYKNNIKVDADSKMITKYKVTPANISDHKVFEDLLDIEKDKHIWADSGYYNKNVFKLIPESIETSILEKATRCHPLTDEQKQSNTEKSKVRVRIEHVFGYMKSTMHGTSSKYIGLERASACMALMNLTYNMCRYEYLTRAKN